MCITSSAVQCKLQLHRGGDHTPNGPSIIPSSLLPLSRLVMLPGARYCTVQGVAVRVSQDAALVSRNDNGSCLG